MFEGEALSIGIAAAALIAWYGGHDALRTSQSALIGVPGAVGIVPDWA